MQIISKLCFDLVLNVVFLSYFLCYCLMEHGTLIKMLTILKKKKIHWLLHNRVLGWWIMSLRITVEFTEINIYFYSIPQLLYLAVLSESLCCVSFHQDYTYHLMSAICEWTVAFGFIFFFLTFIRDFKVGIHIFYQWLK